MTDRTLVLPGILHIGIGIDSSSDRTEGVRGIRRRRAAIVVVVAIRTGVAPIVMLLGTVVRDRPGRGVGRRTTACDGAAGRRGRMHGVDGGGLGAVAVAPEDLLGGDFGVVAEEGGIV